MKRLASTSIFFLILVSTLHAGLSREYSQSYDLRTLGIHVEASAVFDDISQTVKTEVTLTGSAVDLLNDELYVVIYFLDDGFRHCTQTLSERNMVRNQDTMTYSQEITYGRFAILPIGQDIPFAIDSILVSIPDLLGLEEMAAFDDRLEEHEKLDAIPPFLYGQWNMESSRVFFADGWMSIGNDVALLDGGSRNNNLSILGFYSEKNLFIVGIRYNRQNINLAFVRTNDINRVSVYRDGVFLTTMRRSDV